MLKYDCVAAINEGHGVKGDYDYSMKYALIVSPSRLYSADYLLLSYGGRSGHNIKHGGLSSTAMTLYYDLFGVDMDTIYRDDQSNYYTKIWEGNFIYSPYLMTNSELFREYFTRKYGHIQNLKRNF